MVHRTKHQDHHERLTYSRSRSASPSEQRPPSAQQRHHRSRHIHPSRHHHRSKPTALTRPQSLPYNASLLSKNDPSQWRALFALYLDVQKQLILEDLSSEQVRGRWKRFVGRWNNGELAEGWYDPATKLKASSSLSADPTASHAGDDHDEQDRPRKRRPSPDYDPTTAGYAKVDRDSASSSSDDDALGPSLPAPNQARPPGPAIPSLDDLALRADDAGAAQADVLADLSHARRLDRAAQRAALDELAPRADPGTRERRLEKRAAVAEKLRGYRERSPVAEVDEGELMGGAGDGREQLRRDRDRWERRKSEREIRKEEVLRARAEEREEKLQLHREKEEKTMAGLKALARQNFG